MKHAYAIEGMHCASCVAKIAGALERIPGILKAAVSLTPPGAEVDMQAHVPTSRLQEAVASAGPYRLRELAAPAMANPNATDETAANKESLYPLLLIVGFIAGVVLLIEAVSGTFAVHRAMQHFMAGFFLVFSFFKFLDLRGFADAYRSYDVVAKKVPAWSFVYPFVELALGVAYLTAWHLDITNWVTLVVMAIGAIGVLKALLNKRAIRCACLGTVLNLPMTKVTFVEDAGMALMAAIMLFL